MIDIFKPALSLQNMHGHYQNINISQEKDIKYHFPCRWQDNYGVETFYSNHTSYLCLEKH